MMGFQLGVTYPSISQRLQAQFFRQFTRIHGIGQILFVCKNQQNSLSQFILLQLEKKMGKNVIRLKLKRIFQTHCHVIQGPNRRNLTDHILTSCHFKNGLTDKLFSRKYLKKVIMYCTQPNFVKFKYLLLLKVYSGDYYICIVFVN